MFIDDQGQTKNAPRAPRPGILSMVFSIDFMTLSRKARTFQRFSCNC